MVNFLIKTVRKIISHYYSIRNYCNFRINKVKSKTFLIKGVIQIINKGNIHIGLDFRANSGRSKNPIGGDTVLRLITETSGVINIGDNVGISNSTLFSKENITIMNGVLIGGGCSIWDSDFHSLDKTIRGGVNDIGVSKPILIKENAWLGGKTIVLKGVTIGENSIIGAGSVVTKSIPDNQIWAGNPAKFIKNIDN